MVGQRSGVVRGIQQNHVAADFALQLRRRSQRDQVSFIHDGQPIAALGFFHQVRGYEHGDVLFVAQNLQILPQVAARAGIEAGGRFVEQQDAGMMQQSLGEFDAPLHAAGERLDAFLGAIGQSDPRQNFSDALSSARDRAGRKDVPDARGSRTR